ncbi:MAG TPA: GNAT family N-acetyltransferase [Nevskiaceae bacterium]|nr:GNAT family N-acetyltransferase [Nevskiaceae bacterium]
MTAILLSERLRLAPLTGQDAAPLHQLLLEPAVSQGLFEGRRLSREQAEQLAGRSEWSHGQGEPGLWTLALRQPVVPWIGFAGFWSFGVDDERPELSYALAPAWRARGYAAEAVRTVLGAVFASGAIREIRATTEAANLASLRLLQRIGFLPDGQRAARRGQLCLRLPRGVYLGRALAAGGPADG